MAAGENDTSRFMPRRLKLVSVVLLPLTVIFYFFFMFAKHDPVLSAIMPFGEDPYDAIGSFALIVGGLLLLLALVRAFRPYRKGPPTAAQRLGLIRTQMAVALAVFITAVADGITMVRHPLKWLGQPGGNELVLLVVSMALVAVAVGLLTHRSGRQNGPADGPAWWKAGVVSFFSVVALALYPEAIIQTLSGHLFSILLGDVLLFAPLSAWVVVLIPGNVQPAPRGENAGWPSRGWIRWGAIVLLGLAVGAFCLLGEASEGAGIPSARIALVVSVYLGLGLTGLVVAYSFLRRPLGLFQEATQER